MEIINQQKLAKHIFRLLKVTEITFPIGRTNKGNLGLKFSAISDDFEIMLDAVPLSTKDALNDDNNIELKVLIEKYWFGAETITLSSSTPEQTTYISAKRKPGRPKKQ